MGLFSTVKSKIKKNKETFDGSSEAGKKQSVDQKKKTQINNATKKINTSIKNWYADKYFMLKMQRSFLFVFVIASTAILIASLVLVKSLYEQKSTFPYLVTVDDDSNILTIIESEGHAKYTAQESIKNYFITRFIKKAEGFDRNSFEDSYNIVRILSDTNVFGLLKTVMKSRLSSIPTSSRGSAVDVKIELDFKTIVYQSAQRAVVELVRKTTVEGSPAKLEELSVVVYFKFVNLEITLEDRRENPLGFQVFGYNSIKKQNV